MEDPLKIYQSLNDHHIILSYNGTLTSEVIDHLVLLAEDRLSSNDVRIGVKRKVINVIVECLQNSFHYCSNVDDQPLITFSPYLVLVQNESEISVISGNYVTADRAEFLEGRLTEFSAYDEDKLKNYYLTTINKEILPEKGGAGLGLIDIIRRSDNNIIFGFNKLENDYILFCLQIKINI